MDSEIWVIAEADRAQSLEGNTEGARRRGEAPEACSDRFRRSRGAGACAAGVAEELGSSRFLRRKTEPPSEALCVSEAGEREVGVPQ